MNQALVLGSSRHPAEDRGSGRGWGKGRLPPTGLRPHFSSLITFPAPQPRPSHEVSTLVWQSLAAQDQVSYWMSRPVSTRDQARGFWPVTMSAHSYCFQTHCLLLCPESHWFSHPTFSLQGPPRAWKLSCTLITFTPLLQEAFVQPPTASHVYMTGSLGVCLSLPQPSSELLTLTKLSWGGRDALFFLLS